jgi:3-dehydroquinate dehydratase
LTDRDVNIEWPQRVVEHIPEDVLLAVAALSDAEAAVLREGLQRLPPALAKACETVIVSWHALTGTERLTALVALAEAMASLNDRA